LKIGFEVLQLRVKKHPLTAYNILDVSDVFKPIKEIVKGHHEKYDGSGYPEGLIGEAIPIGARIVSITDGSGTHFDATLVELFIPMANEVFRSWSNLNISPDPEELMPH
jgi:HD-GYP domain-containing protein (c-di-GMP phosphodiesterase class II)